MFYNTEQGCYRKEKCQYLHNIGATEKVSDKQEYEGIQEKEVPIFKCDQCSFNSSGMATLNKHMNTKHQDINSIETVSTFIFRLGLEELASEYKYHFKRYGYTTAEAQHVEKMVRKYGVDYILRP